MVADPLADNVMKHFAEAASKGLVKDPESCVTFG